MIRVVRRAGMCAAGLPGLPGGVRGGSSVRAARTSPGSLLSVTATASAALAGLLHGPMTAGRVLAAGPQAVSLRVSAPGARVVSLVTGAAVRLPCALVVTGEGVPLAGVRPGTGALVGGGTVLLPSGAGRSGRLLEIRPGRWWDPRPRLGPVEPGGLAARLTAAEALLPPWPADAPGPTGACPRLESARAVLESAHGDGGEAVLAGAVRGLVGLGPGSTPSGDDLLAGVLAAARLFGEALGAASAVSLADDLAGVTRPLLGRTTTLSAALLEHAARAEVCAPAASLCRALEGLEPLRPALSGLLAVGHTSGADLAAGLLSGARLALRCAGSGGVPRP